MQFANLPAIKLAETLTEITPRKSTNSLLSAGVLKRLKPPLNSQGIIIMEKVIKSATKSSPAGELIMV